MFQPSKLFKTLFYKTCNDFISAHVATKIEASRFLEALEVTFARLFAAIAAGSTSREIHLQQLRRLRQHFVNLRTQKTCLCCMLKSPEKLLDCGHSICNTCVAIFGVRSARERYSFDLLECMLCARPHPRGYIQLVPPTASARILSIDGGGVRSVVPLILLAYMEQKLASLGCPLRDYFDLVCSTLTGMINHHL